MKRNRPHGQKLRKGRHSAAGTYYFLTACAANRQRIFLSRRRAAIVLDAIRWIDDTGRLSVDAAVVMPDHLHIAGKLNEFALQTVMHTLKGYTAKQLSRVGVEPPVWQKGYHDHVLRDDEDYLTKLRYLLNNPVRAGLVSSRSDYPHMFCKFGDS